MYKIDPLQCLTIPIKAQIEGLSSFMWQLDSFLLQLFIESNVNFEWWFDRSRMLGPNWIILTKKKWKLIDSNSLKLYLLALELKLCKNSSFNHKVFKYTNILNLVCYLLVVILNLLDIIKISNITLNIKQCLLASWLVL